MKSIHCPISLAPHESRKINFFNHMLLTTLLLLILPLSHFSCVRLCVTPWILSLWCHPAISSSVIPFSSYHKSLPASESFSMSQLLAWGGQSIRVSALASVLPKNTQDWPPLEWTSWISLQSKGLSRVFSNITVQKHQFFSAQLSSQANSHIHTWPQEKP